YVAAYEATLRLWPVPYQPRESASRFGKTHLVVCGPEEAPPLVLLHCFFTSLTTWAYNVADLSQHHRVYALDVMGQPSRSVPDEPVVVQLVLPPTESRRRPDARPVRPAVAPVHAGP